VIIGCHQSSLGQLPDCIWHGQFKGKKGIPTISLEAVSDYNLWIWNSAFGFPGSLNDLNIWEKSPLFNSMTDGTIIMR
jgi:hypothetical protein